MKVLKHHETKDLAMSHTIMNMEMEICVDG